MAGIRVYRHSNFGGTSAFWNHGAGWRYYRIPALSPYGLNDSVSSARVYANEGESFTGILFQHNSYKGRFVAFQGLSPNNAIASLGGGLDFNDRTSSILTIRHSRNEFISIPLGEHGRADAEAMVDEKLADDDRGSRRGRIVFTWEMWPSFDPTKKFVRIDIPVRVHVPAWWDYDARITYYLYLYIDSLHRLRGYVNWVETWVEGGILSGSINGRLFPQAMQMSGELTGHFNDALSDLDFHEWSYYYLMPGSAPLARPQDYSGDVADDVSIILVRRD